MAPDVYRSALESGKYWCTFATKTFIPHEGFITNIFSLLNHKETQSKAINIIKRLLVKSKYVKLL